MDDEFARHELIEAFAVFVSVSVAVAVEVLADEDRHAATVTVRGAHFLVERDHRACGQEDHLPRIELHLVLARLERQVEHAECEHHLRKVSRRIGKRLRQERRLAIVHGVVVPKRIHGNEVGNLQPDRQVIIVILRPLHRRIDLTIQYANRLALIVSLEVLDFLVIELFHLFVVFMRICRFIFRRFIFHFAIRRAIALATQRLAFLARFHR